MGNQRNGHYDFVLPMADDKDFQDNARLISAAPDLLDACKKAEQFARDYGEDCLADILASAINKAEGNN